MFPHRGKVLRENKKKCRLLKLLDSIFLWRKFHWYSVGFPDHQSTGQKSIICGDKKIVNTRSTMTQSVSAAETSSDTTNCLHLTDLLKHYLNEEKLTGDNKYKSEFCNSLQEADSIINILKPPERGVNSARYQLSPWVNSASSWLGRVNSAEMYFKRMKLSFNFNQPFASYKTCLWFYGTHLVQKPQTLTETKRNAYLTKAVATQLP